TKSPSPQTIIPGKRLNHFSFGTSGSVSSQSANKLDSMPLNPACPASLDTLKVSVPPAVKLAAATRARSAPKLIGRNLTRTNSIKQMIQQHRRKIVSRLAPAALARYLAAVPAMSLIPLAPFCRRILGIVARAVEPSNDRFADSCRFDGIRGVDHALRQAGQFASGQMPLSVELISKADDT